MIKVEYATWFERMGDYGGRCPSRLSILGSCDAEWPSVFDRESVSHALQDHARTC
jgi:hypothetical protein